MASKKEEAVDSSNTCVVCFKGVEIYSIGQCDHPVCFECSTRMRVLCRQFECPICRQEMPKVIFTKNIRPFSTMKNDNYLTDYKFQICFETQDEVNAFDLLLEHECPKCKKKFSSFSQLRDHVRRTHFLTYCELCVENLTILSRERRCYTRQELATHRRLGDTDDRSHRGHPLCVFCDTRYMDNDELYRHLRRDHLYCHFCDADGLHQYYNTYEFLREHFRNEHYLCEEGECYNEQFTAVFRTDIDLKAHRTAAHGKGLGKAGLKQARTLDIAFTLAPRPRPIPRSRQYREEDADVGAVGGTVLEEPATAERNSVFAQINTDCIEEFPSLGGSPAPNTGSGPVVPAAARSTARRVMRRGSGKFCVDDFPALGPETTQVSLKVNSERPQKQLPSSSNIQTTRPSSTNVSIQVNHPRFTTTVTSHNTYNYHFPALDSGTNVAGPAATSTSVHWTSKRLPPDNKPSPSSHQGLVTTAGTSGHDPPPGLEAYPVLTPASKSKTTTVQADNQTQSVNTTRVLSASSSTDCDQPTVPSSKTKKKKSKSKNTNAAINVELPAKEAEANSKKKPNNQDVKSCGDSSANAPAVTKKKAKENMVHSSNETKTNNNVNNINNSNRKVLKSPKLENVKANKINHADKKKEDSSKTVQEKEKSDTGMEKKRDKVKSLSERTLIEPDAFPALGRGVPPGFEPKWQVKRPPPGLEKPPGLIVPVSSTTSAPPGFNPLNGFPPLGSSLDSAKTEYKTPPNFAERNRTLVTEMESALGLDSFELFKQVSFTFRSGNMPPLEYYSTCRKIMGPNTFSELFPELLALLPDIEKQQELWTVYKSEFRKDQQIHASSSTKKKGNGVVSPLEVCATCYQVVTSSDLRSHLTCHALDNHFPALDTHNTTYNNNNNNNHNNNNNNNAWVHK